MRILATFLLQQLLHDVHINFLRLLRPLGAHPLGLLLHRDREGQINEGLIPLLHRAGDRIVAVAGLAVISPRAGLIPKFERVLPHVGVDLRLDVVGYHVGKVFKRLFPVQGCLILSRIPDLVKDNQLGVDKIVQGNAQPLDAKIMTPDGYKLMGEVAVGDEVLTPDGKVTRIDGVYPRGVRKVYNVTRRDGSTTRACNEHLWKVQISDEDYAKLMDLLTDDA